MEELRAQVENTGSETQVELQRKTEEAIGLASKVSGLESSVAELRRDTQSQRSSLEERDQECATLRKGLEHAESLKAGLEREVKALRDASTTSTEEVKRLSGTVSSKDLELEGLREEAVNSIKIIWAVFVGHFLGRFLPFLTLAV